MKFVSRLSVTPPDKPSAYSLERLEAHHKAMVDRDEFREDNQNEPVATLLRQFIDGLEGLDSGEIFKRAFRRKEDLAGTDDEILAAFAKVLEAFCNAQEPLTEMQPFMMSLNRPDKQTADRLAEEQVDEVFRTNLA
jgi:hypothetical protein